jgi:hypothetical protein
MKIKVQVVLGSYNAVIDEVRVVTSERAALDQLSEWAEEEFATRKAFEDWQENEMTDANELRWFEDEIEVDR